MTFSDAGNPAGSIRARIVGIVAMLVLCNIAAWIVALKAVSAYSLLLATAVVAYTFGLRHAVDADHISAIDNVTRKLVNDGKRPVSVGLFFSLGHSTIVIGLSLAVALTTSLVRTKLPALEHAGSVVGTSISALFLLAIGTVNAVVLAGIVRESRRAHKSGTTAYESATLFSQRGLLGRLFAPLLRMVSKSWHMYPVGLLFGLGFDTATEVAVLGIAAIQAARGLPVYAILIFPLLFTAGMCLVDTIDGMFMLGAYRWAVAKPLRTFHYNVVVTLISVLAALVVGCLQAFDVLRSQLGLQGWLRGTVGGVEGSFGALGAGIIAVFALSWAVAALAQGLRRIARGVGVEEA